MKDYYGILGVSRTAHQSDIKRAYRKLVHQLHPDVNPNPEAQERIKDINEAYDVLGDEAKRRLYDENLQNPFQNIEVEPPRPHRDPAYRRTPTGFRAPQEAGQTVLMKKSISAIGWMAWASLVFCGFLVVDYLLPSRVHQETIIQVEEVYKTFRMRLYHEEDKLITDTGREVIISKEETGHFRNDSVLVVVESRLFRIPSKIKSSSGSYSLSNLATIYANFLFLPVLLLIASLVGVVVKNGSVDFHFSLGLVILALFIFTLIFLLNG
jgi:hypothetical protein